MFKFRTVKLNEPITNKKWLTRGMITLKKLKKKTRRFCDNLFICRLMLLHFGILTLLVILTSKSLLQIERKCRKILAFLVIYVSHLMKTLDRYGEYGGTLSETVITN